MMHRSGLIESLKGHNKAQDAATMQKEFQQGLEGHDTKLSVADLWNA